MFHSVVVHPCLVLCTGNNIMMMQPMYERLQRLGCSGPSVSLRALVVRTIMEPTLLVAKSLSRSLFVKIQHASSLLHSPTPGQDCCESLQALDVTGYPSACVPPGSIPGRTHGADRHSSPAHSCDSLDAFSRVVQTHCDRSSHTLELLTVLDAYRPSSAFCVIDVVQEIHFGINKYISRACRYLFSHGGPCSRQQSAL